MCRQSTFCLTSTRAQMHAPEQEKGEQEERTTSHAHILHSQNSNGREMTRLDLGHTLNQKTSQWQKQLNKCNILCCFFLSFRFCFVCFILLGAVVSGFALLKRPAALLSAGDCVQLDLVNTMFSQRYIVTDNNSNHQRHLLHHMPDHVRSTNLVAHD